MPLFAKNITPLLFRRASAQLLDESADGTGPQNEIVGFLLKDQLAPATERRRHDHNTGLSLVEKPFVIPSAVEESLTFNTLIVRDVSTFARHDKVGTSTLQGARRAISLSEKSF